MRVQLNCPTSPDDCWPCECGGEGGDGTSTAAGGMILFSAGSGFLLIMKRPRSVECFDPLASSGVCLVPQLPGRVMERAGESTASLMLATSFMFDLMSTADTDLVLPQPPLGERSPHA